MRLMIQIGLLALAAITLSTCSATKSASAEAMPKTPAGSWNTEVMGTPMGNITVEMVLIKEGDSYSGYLIAGEEKMDLNDLKVSENNIRANFYARTYETEVTMDAVYNPETDTIEGWLLDNFRLIGKRKEVAAGK